MGKWLHRLSNIDTVSKTAICAYCKDTVVIKDKGNSWRCNNALKDIDRNRKYRKRYNISPSEVPQSCEVCGGNTRISYDHCHNSGVFRGWLCMKCNTTLGLVNDDIKILEKLIEYLKKRR